MRDWNSQVNNRKINNPEKFLARLWGIETFGLEVLFYDTSKFLARLWGIETTFLKNAPYLKV